MTTTQILSVIAAVAVAALYLKDVRWGSGTSREPAMMVHLRNIIAVREAYRSPEVTSRCNALMEALLGIKS